MTYKAWVVGDGRKEWIEDYEDLDEAVMDVLTYWLEDKGDVFIEDQDGKMMVYMARGTDPSKCLVFQDGRSDAIYRVKYVTEGRVHAKVEQLA